MGRKIIVALLLCVICMAGFGQEVDAEETSAADEMPFVVFLPLGYDFIRLENQSFRWLGNQTFQRPAAGVGLMYGEQDLPFTQVDRRFLAMAMYQPFVFTETPAPGVPKNIHKIDAIFDGRINRHQFLYILKSASDKPIAGGLHTFQTGLGWAYEVIRQPHVSLILGAALGVSDFTLSEDVSTPVLPLPLIRFGIDTHWFVSSFDFLTGPNFSFTLAPKEKIRLTGDMRMDYYRSIDDLICEYIIWYSLGEFVGIGAGFKHDSVEFTLSADKATFELQQSSVILAVDFSLVLIQCGWIFDSRYLINGIETNRPGSGLFVSVQGMIPLQKALGSDSIGIK